MEIKEYISSGILELYAAGMLTETESSEVEDILRKFPEAKNEYEKIQNALHVALSQNLRTPPDKVKSSLLNKITKLNQLNKINQVEAKTQNLSESKVDNLPNQRSGSSYRYLMAASIAFLVLSLGANFFLWKKLKDADSEIAVLSDQKKVIVQEYEAVYRKLSKASEDMKIIQDPSYTMVDLKGLEKSPSSDVLAFWNPQTKKVYVKVMNLPVPPPDKQYQLWALSNGKPIDAGVMDVDPSDSGLHEMKSMDDAQAFAITLEPKGGSVNPTMDQMYAMGKI